MEKIYKTIKTKQNNNKIGAQLLGTRKNVRPLPHKGLGGLLELSTSRATTPRALAGLEGVREG